MAVWEFLALAILILSMPVGLIAVVLGLPGTWLILVASVFYGWLTNFAIITLQLLLGLFALAVVAELLDLTAGLWGARRYGGTKKAMVGTMIGGILGASGSFIRCFRGGILDDLFGTEKDGQSYAGGVGGSAGSDLCYSFQRGGGCDHDWLGCLGDIFCEGRITFEARNAGKARKGRKAILSLVLIAFLACLALLLTAYF
jgi:uncharacterized protein YqgC (DUF456 family)